MAKVLDITDMIANKYEPRCYFPRRPPVCFDFEAMIFDVRSPLRCTTVEFDFVLENMHISAFVFSSVRVRR